MLDFSFSIVDETTTALMFTRNETRFFSLAVSTKTSPTPSVVQVNTIFGLISLVSLLQLKQYDID